MLVVNLQNVEELIFQDNNVRQLLPELRHLFDQWMLSKRIPSLRSLRLQSFMDLLNGLSADHIAKLEEYFEDGLVIDKLDYHIVKNLTLPLEFDPDKELVDCKGYNSFAVTRDAEQVYISFWR